MNTERKTDHRVGKHYIFPLLIIAVLSLHGWWMSPTSADGEGAAAAVEANCTDGLNLSANA